MKMHNENITMDNSLNIGLSDVAKVTLYKSDPNSDDSEERIASKEILNEIINALNVQIPQNVLDKDHGQSPRSHSKSRKKHKKSSKKSKRKHKNDETHKETVTTTKKKVKKIVKNKKRKSDSSKSPNRVSKNDNIEKHKHKSSKSLNKSSSRKKESRDKCRDFSRSRSGSYEHHCSRSRDLKCIRKRNHSNSEINSKLLENDKLKKRRRIRSRSKSRSRSISRSRTRSRSKHEYRHKSSRRSRSRNRLHINRKKLLEIARKNAIEMLKNGTLPGTLHMSRSSKQKILTALQTRGKSVDELTEFCKKISQKEAEEGFDNEFLIKSDDEDTSFHHPFQLKEKAPIIINIKNAAPIPPKSLQEQNNLRLQFPVSSGEHHRQNESIFFSPSTTILEPNISIDNPNHLADSNFAKETVATAAPLVWQKLPMTLELQEKSQDISFVPEIGNKLSMIPKWPEKRQDLNSFMNHTGVNMFKKSDFNVSNPQVYAKRNQLKQTQPINGGLGMQLLQKMGWKPGEGLGKEKTGTLEPLLLSVKLDKHGLIAVNENESFKSKKTVKTLEGKHPVSLLGEYASKRKLENPIYELCFECGPDHQKNFLYKVILNGNEYRSNVASLNKKQAKAEAARICLEHLGLITSSETGKSNQNTVS